MNHKFTVKLPNSQTMMTNRSVTENSVIHRPVINLRQKVNSYVVPRVSDVIREHVRAKVHENLRYVNPDHDQIKAISMQIPDKDIDQELIEYQDFPVHLAL